ncbi:SH3 domain-containing protein [Oscillibacter sp.]|uniref:SH3 domain-containing protein n=1 Tax=Oscillibacter sp. TaxID=1945593 RepID=UPI003392BC23
MTASSLNVRSTPDGAIVDGLKRNTVVTVLEVHGAWSRIGADRWVSTSYLKA